MSDTETTYTSFENTNSNLVATIMQSMGDRVESVSEEYRRGDYSKITTITLRPAPSKSEDAA
ncbi:hypothetical protein [Profundibacter sp.]